MQTNENEQVRKTEQAVLLLGIYSLSFQSLALQTIWFSLQLFYNFPAALFTHPNLKFKCCYKKLSVFPTVT